MKNSFWFLFFITSLTFSQEFELSGVVVNAENEPIVFANVLLLTSKDSTIIDGTSTDEHGAFVFNTIKKGNYLLKASYIENSSIASPISVTSDSNIGTIVIAETNHELDEVVVTYQKPTLERKVDRLVFNVENTALADGTIWELLKQTPNVSVIQNKLSIKGNGNIGVMINGRKANIPEADIINLLSGSSASNVEAIEVITNPPLKYSAEGGMLINIKMSKNLVAGYNGAIFNNYEQGVFLKNTVGTDHFFKGKKTSFSVNYSFNNAKNIYRYTGITTFFENEEPTSVWTANQNITLRRKRHNVSAFFDYDIDANNSLSLSTINVFKPSKNRYSYSATLTEDLSGALLSQFNTLNDSNEEQMNTSFYADWVHKLKKKGAEISLSSHYTYYDSKSGQDLATDFLDNNGNFTGENDFQTQSNQKINLYSIATDFSTPLSETTQLEAGFRYAGIQSESNISQEGFDRNQPGVDPTEAGLFTYEEATFAAYTSYDAKWNLWTLKTGIRAEYTDTKGELDMTNNPNTNSYLKFFPSLSLQYTPSKKHAYKLSYFRRIQRPRYNDINPFQYFQSNNTVQEGNPNLLPGTRDWFAGEYTFDRNYSITLFHFKWNNDYRLLTFQDNESNLLRFISSNVEIHQGYGADIVINKNISKTWRVYALLSYFNNEEQFRDLDSGMLIKNSIWNGIFRLSNGLTILQDRSLVVNLNFSYYTPAARGNSQTDSYSHLGLRFRKTVWNKNGSISLGISDIFNQGNRFTSRDYLNQKNSSLYRSENRLFTLGLRYKFGNVRMRNNKKSKRLEERKRI